MIINIAILILIPVLIALILYSLWWDIKTVNKARSDVEKRYGSKHYK